MIVRSLSVAFLLASAGTAYAQAAPASQGQVNQIDKRVGTLESQMRAVQRQVFPGGDKRFFAPEVTAEPAPVTTTGTPATPALVDLTQRVEALETQQRQLTGQVETLQFQMRQLEEAMKKLRGDAEFRLDALEGKTPGSTVPQGAAVTTPVPVPAPPKIADTPPAKVPPAKVPAPTQPVAQTSAPAAGPAADSAEARYTAGYKLYTDGKYAEAATELNDFVADNPKSVRASNAQFWAGRSLLAQGKTADAAKAFLGGYQKYPRGERAHNSLLWLGKSLLELNQAKAACQALDQLKTAYPEKLTGQFAADATATRAQAKCGN